MLEKMGWKGQGLGRESNGILEPVLPAVNRTPSGATRTVGLGAVALPGQPGAQDGVHASAWYKTRARYDVL
jgi:hypothetical protein